MACREGAFAEKADYQKGGRKETEGEAMSTKQASQEAPQAILCPKCGHRSTIKIPDRAKQKKNLMKGKKYWYAYYYICPACSHLSNPKYAQRQPSEFPLKAEDIASIPLTMRMPPKRKKRLMPPCGTPWGEWYHKTYIKSEHFKKLRAEAIRGAHATCQDCGKVSCSTMHIHHINYKSLGHEAPGDIVVLCARCHARRHGKLKEQA